MSDWKIISSEIVTAEIINELVGGSVPSIYTIEFIESGETRRVIAESEDELGRKIERGEFDD